MYSGAPPPTTGRRPTAPGKSAPAVCSGRPGLRRIVEDEPKTQARAELGKVVTPGESRARCRGRSRMGKGLPMSSAAEAFVSDRYFVPVPDEIEAHDLPVIGTLPP